MSQIKMHGLGWDSITRSFPIRHCQGWSKNNLKFWEDLTDSISCDGKDSGVPSKPIIDLGQKP